MRLNDVFQKIAAAAETRAFEKLARRWWAKAMDKGLLSPDTTVGQMGSLMAQAEGKAGDIGEAYRQIKPFSRRVPVAGMGLTARMEDIPMLDLQNAASITNNPIQRGNRAHGVRASNARADEMAVRASSLQEAQTSQLERDLKAAVEAKFGKRLSSWNSSDGMPRPNTPEYMPKVIELINEIKAFEDDFRAGRSASMLS
jgi:hypothetical protein